jgi:diacylglycerol kinase family enzyme
MVNSLLTEGGGMENLQRTTIGAIGLGSSNDFHKPYTEGHFVGRLPVKVDDVNAKLCDVGRIEYKDSSGEEAVRHFIINASLGATAHANFFFNHPNWLLRKLKRWSTNLAIGYTAVRTIIGFRNEQVTIKDGAKVRGCGVSNLAVLKRPYFSKDFFYDVPMSLDDGRLSVNLCADMSKLEMLRALRQLTKGRLTSSKWSSWSTEGLGIGTERPIPVETDGEVILAQDIRFSVLARTVRVCC